jgi:nicotinamide-nucleotide amidase
LGASSFFLGGVVSYANQVKEQVLGVSAQDLEKYGAVSEPVARQMAEGVRKALGAQYAVSTTGIAGPDGGTKEKPVGTIWMAVAGPNGTVAEKCLISHTRERNIGRGSVHAIQLLLSQIEKDQAV